MSFYHTTTLIKNWSLYNKDLQKNEKFLCCIKPFIFDIYLFCFLCLLPFFVLSNNRNRRGGGASPVVAIARSHIWSKRGTYTPTHTQISVYIRVRVSLYSKITFMTKNRTKKWRNQYYQRILRKYTHVVLNRLSTR